MTSLRERIEANKRTQAATEASVRWAREWLIEELSGAGVQFNWSPSGDCIIEVPGSWTPLVVRIMEPLTPGEGASFTSKNYGLFDTPNRHLDREALLSFLARELSQ